MKTKYNLLTDCRRDRLEDLTYGRLYFEATTPAEKEGILKEYNKMRRSEELDSISPIVGRIYNKFIH